MAETENLPAQSVASDAEFLKDAGLDPMRMSMGLAIFMKPNFYQHCKGIALRMSEAKGVIGDHLIGNPSACMAILSRAITWNLDPFAVAQCTYAVKGKVGYEGKLIQAILENSGQLEGRVTYEYCGDWAKLRGKFHMEDSGREGKRAVADWKPEDEDGLSIIVRAQVRGETTPREEEFFLAEMWPRNSTLWATRPKQQMIYASVRAFSNIATPGILMGIPFDVSQEDMVDITPSRPERSEFEQAPERGDSGLGDWTAKINYANTVGEVSQLRKDGLAALPVALHARFEETCDGRARQIASKIPEGDHQPEPPPPDDDTSRGSGAPDDSVDKETPFQRGIRLLGLVTLSADVRDVFETIVEELKGKKDRDLWKQTAEARFTELGGQGPMLVDAKKKK